MDDVLIEAVLVREADVCRTRSLSKCVPKLRGPLFLLRRSCRRNRVVCRGRTLAEALDAQGHGMWEVGQQRDVLGWQLLCRP